MRVVTVVWHGTQTESLELVTAIANNCSCEFGFMGARLSTCPPHRMLTEDQRALNGLLFARSMRARLQMEEHGEQQPIVEMPQYAGGPFKEPD